MSICAAALSETLSPLPTTCEIDFGTSPSGHLFTVRGDVPIDEALQSANAILNTIRVLADERCDATVEAAQALNHAIECLTEMSSGLVAASLQGVHASR
ncbi:DUF3077 domain-containing protein [Pseudomonas sp. App30]|uniref:DUF3077 domain-containing protein n=1 Tax=Pseudomonas sp. App30 TaxID=3068990 RepID=UPI003A8003BD